MEDLQLSRLKWCSTRGYGANFYALQGPEYIAGWPWIVRSRTELDCKSSAGKAKELVRHEYSTGPHIGREVSGELDPGYQGFKEQPDEFN